MPAMTTHSPCAKFIAPVLLNTTLNPSADEGVDAACAETGDEQLENDGFMRHGRQNDRMRFDSNVGRVTPSSASFVRALAM